MGTPEWWRIWRGGGSARLNIPYRNAQKKKKPAVMPASMIRAGC